MEASIAEEEFIDMDVSSSATLFCHTLPSSPPPQPPRDFEFQMSGKPPPEIDGMTSPADELFFEGKLLPLHLPLRAVEKKLAESMASASASANATPYESCYASPATSCYVSGELNPESYFAEEPEQAQPRARNNRSWTKRLKLIKQSSSLGLKLRASRAYLKSLFTKSRCSDKSYAVPKKASGDAGRAPRALGRVDAGEEGRGHRRSFSGAIKRRASDKSSSTSTSSSSSGSSSFSSVNSNNGPQVPKRRSSSVNSEVECSIQGAIAYCKKSQQEVCARKSVSDVEFYALSASRIAADCEKPGICRGSLMLLSTGQGYST